MRRFALHSWLYLLARCGSAGFSFAALFIFTRLLPPRDYGYYAVYIAIVATLSTMLFGWLKLSALRFWPDEKYRSVLIDAISFSFKALSLVYLCLAGVVIIMIPNTVSAGGLPFTRQWVVLVAISTIALAIYDLYYETLRASLNPFAVLMMVVTRGLLYLLVGISAALTGFAAYAPAIGIVIGTMIAIVVARRYADFQFVFTHPGGLTPTARWLLLKEIIPYGLPLSVSLFGAALVIYTDRLMIAYFRGSAEAGIYAASFELVNGVINLPLSALALASFPLMVRALSQKSSRELSSLLAKNLSAIMLVGVPVVATVMLYRDVVATLLGAEYTRTAVTILPSIAIAIYLNTIRMYHYDRAFHFSKRTCYLAVIMIITSMVNLILNYLLIPKIGLLGAVYSSIAAYALALVMSITVGMKIFPLVGFPFSAVLATMLTLGAYAVTVNILRSYPCSRVAQAAIQNVIYIILYLAYRHLMRLRKELD